MTNRALTILAVLFLTACGGTAAHGEGFDQNGVPLDEPAAEPSATAAAPEKAPATKPAAVPPASVATSDEPEPTEPPNGTGGRAGAEPEGTGGDEPDDDTSTGGVKNDGDDSTGGTVATGGAQAETGGMTNTGGTESTGGNPGAGGLPEATGGAPVVVEPTPSAPAPEKVRVVLWQADVNVQILPNGNEFYWPRVTVEPEATYVGGAPSSLLVWPMGTAGDVGAADGTQDFSSCSSFTRLVSVENVTTVNMQVRVVNGCKANAVSCTDRRVNAAGVLDWTGATELKATRTVKSFGANGDKLAVHFEITGIR